jgi:hypothetical protein
MVLACAAAVTAGAHGQDAVQWRVQDGGNGHWYRVAVVSTALTWSAANAAATEVGAHLASISSAEENAFVRNLSLSTPGGVRNAGGTTVGPWIGAHRDPLTGILGWSSGEPWSFAAWCGGEPSGPSWEDAVCYFTGSLCWNDRPGDFVGSTACRSAVQEWSADCNGDGLVDYGQIRASELDDADGNNVPDCCEQGTICDPCPGDITGNGTVNGLDLAAILAAWGSDGQSKFDCDVDNSGVVDGGDLAFVLAGWGACP